MADGVTMDTTEVFVGDPEMLLGDGPPPITKPTTGGETLGRTIAVEEQESVEVAAGGYGGLRGHKNVFGREEE